MRSIISLFTVVLFAAIIAVAATPFPADRSNAAETRSSLILAAASPKTGTVNGTQVNIREGPGLSHRIVGKIIKQGTAVQLLGRSGDWIKIYYNGTTGFIYSHYVEVEKEKAVPQPEPTPPEKTAEKPPPPVEEPPPPAEEPPPPVEEPPAPSEESRAETPAPTAPDAGIIRYQIRPDLTGYPEVATGYHRTLQRAMDLVFLFLVSLEKRTDFVLEEKKQKAIDFIRNIRWGPDNRYYFWINDLDGKMILEPLYPEMEGKICLGFKDVTAKEIFADFIKTARDFNQGFVDHQGLGYDGNTSDPRISVVRLFMEWEWIVGTALYLDYIEAYEEPEAVIFNIPLPPITEEIPIDDEGPASPP